MILLLCYDYENRSKTGSKKYRAIVLKVCDTTRVSLFFHYNMVIMIYLGSIAAVDHLIFLSAPSLRIAAS